MAYDATQVDLRAGEKDVIFAEFQAVTDGGEATITAAKFSLYDSLGNIVPGFNQVTADVSPSDLSTVEETTGDVLYNLDTSKNGPFGDTNGNVSGLAAHQPFTVYYGVFDYLLDGNDTYIRKIKPDLQIRLFPFVEVVFSCVSGTDIAKVRRWARDMNGDNPIHGDPDILQYLADTNDGDNPPAKASISQIYMAASLAWEAVAADRAKQAKVQKIAIFQTDKRPLVIAAQAEADRLRKLAGRVGIGIKVGVATGTYNPTAAYPDGRLIEW